MNGIPESQMSEFAPDVIALIGTGAAKVIPLTQGKVVVVDAADYEWLIKYNWTTAKHRHTFYAIRESWVAGKRTTVKMHRDILGFKTNDGNIGDHKDRNGLNNQRYNLRVATASLNAYNRKIQTNNTSGYRGVYWHKPMGQWVVYYTREDKKLQYGGLFTDPICAAKAYDAAMKRIRGEEAILNFPNGSPL